MFSQQVSYELLYKCMHNGITTICPDLIKIVVEQIDKNNGFIFGSTMINYMLLINNNTNRVYKNNDIDIVFTNAEDYNNFTRLLYNLFVNCKDNFEKCNYSTRVTTMQSDIPYAFSELLTSNFDDKVISLSIFSNDSNKCNTMNIHCILTILQQNINLDTKLKIIFEQLLMYPLLCNVYNKNTVFSHYKSFDAIESYQIVNKYEEKTLNKYKKYGLVIKNITNKLNTSLSKPITFIHDMNIPTHERLSDAKNKYKALGFVVIPLRKTSKQLEGKAPFCKDWINKTREYDFDTKQCANIGILCGKESGICCIDVDLKDNGMFYFEKMVAKYYLPHCPVQETPNGGRHYIFKFNENRMKDMQAVIKALRVNGNKIGIDMWIQRCQFVAEPSINYVVNKAYKWIVPLTTKDAIPELPDWIYDAYTYKNISEDGTILKDDYEYNNSNNSSQSTLQSTLQSTSQSTIHESSDNHNSMHNMSFGNLDTCSDTSRETMTISQLDYSNSQSINDIKFDWVSIVFMLISMLCMICIIVFTILLKLFTCIIHDQTTKVLNKKIINSVLTNIIALLE